MSTPASINKHPIHPMLVVFPIGLWVFSLVCDLIYVLGARDPVWNDMAFYTMAGGIVGALIAAVPGFIDFLAIREPQVRRIAITHLTLNLLSVGLYAFNLGLRARSAPGASVPIGLSAITVVILGISGWLGGELVYARGVGVDLRAGEGASGAQVGGHDWRTHDRRVRTTDRRMTPAMR
ncbi:MAG TPA: DUF2231 domain-containing protein [Gemmatimonadales bacterium]|nr:DUF2231 domain-containing protein [Gemmatimonadales bacterium]